MPFSSPLPSPFLASNAVPRLEIFIEASFPLLQWQWNPSSIDRDETNQIPTMEEGGNSTRTISALRNFCVTSSESRRILLQHCNTSTRIERESELQARSSLVIRVLPDQDKNISVKSRNKPEG
jgi:hypothetical protein